jgi:hypothetical protein
MPAGPEAVLPATFGHTVAGVGVIVATVELQSVFATQSVTSFNVGATAVSVVSKYALYFR